MKIVDVIGGRVFSIGAQGEAVREIQMALRSIDYALKGTGYFGPETDTAVTAFQRRAGLTPDGRVGPKTAAALDAAVPGFAGAPNQSIQPSPMIEVSRPLWLEAGIALIGTKEVPGAGDNQVIIDWAKQEGGDIAKDYTHDVIPWCALFENHIFTKVGLKGTETLWALDWNADRMQQRIGRRWPGIRLHGPAVGAVAPMLRNGGGHVITVVGRDQDNNIMGLGANQSDKVSIIPFPLERLKEGFWWPESVRQPTLVGLANLPLVKSDGRVSVKES